MTTTLIILAVILVVIRIVTRGRKAAEDNKRVYEREYRPKKD